MSTRRTKIEPVHHWTGSRRIWLMRSLSSHECGPRKVSADLKSYQNEPNNPALVARIGQAIFVALLTACATPDAPRVSTITTVVKTPDPVACLRADQVPGVPAPTPIDLAAATHAQKDAALAADVGRLREYAKVADPLLRGCVEVKP